MVCKFTMHGLLCCEVPFSKHVHYNLFIALCGSVLLSAFLTIEIKACFDTGDLGLHFGVLPYILWDIWHRHNHQLLPGVCNTMHGLLHCEVSFSKCFQFHCNREPGYKHRHNHHLLPEVCNTLHGLLCSEVPFSKHFHYNLLYCSMWFSTVVCFSDNWNKNLFWYRRSWLTFWSFAVHFVRYLTQA